MIIHLPIFVALDVSASQPIYSDIMNAIGTMTMTLRFDTEDSEVAVECCDHYPPREDAVWSPALALVDLMKARTWNRLIDRVSEWPLDYAADCDEGMRRQIGIDKVNGVDLEEHHAAA